MSTLELWLGFWVGFAPAERALLLLPVLAVVVGALVLGLCRRHPATARIAWPVVLGTHLLAAFALVVLQPEGVRLVPVPQSPGAAPREALDLSPLFALWAVGAALCMLRTAIGVLRFRAGRSTWRVAPAALSAPLTALAERLGVATPALFVAEGVHPACAGVGAPCIVLPTAAERWSRARLEAVLAHELVHAQRRDPRLLLLCAVLADALFWAPGVRAVTDAWRRALEQSCDDEALRLSGSADDYALALVDQVRDVHAPLWLAALTGAAITARVRRVLAGVGAGDFETARVYWPVVGAVLVAAPLILAAPIPVTAEPITGGAPGSMVWLELDAYGAHVVRPPADASRLPAPGAPLSLLPTPAPCPAPGIDAYLQPAPSHPPIQL